MGRCNHGERSEVCKCLELFKLYISTKPGEVNCSTTPDNIKKLFKGRSRDEKRDLCRRMWALMERFKQEVNEAIIADFEDDEEHPDDH